MYLTKMSRTGKAGTARFLATLTDDLGKADYELSIHGPAKLAEETFAKCDVDIVIRPTAGADDVEKLSREVWRRLYPTAAPIDAAPGLEILDKTKVPAATRRDSVVVSLRRVRGEGTFWTAVFPNLFVPAGRSLFFVLPPVCNCSGTLFPLSGDPDLFLSLNGAATPIVASSLRAGTAIDSVFFGGPICWPWAEFVPFFRVSGFRTGVCTFWMSGFGVFP